jgi:IS30 family transposase
MAPRRRRQAKRALRPPMRSPGRPPGWRREHLQQFWAAIARGLSSEDAAIAVGLSPAVGARLFRQAGGMRTISPDPPSGRYLSFTEREEIAILTARGRGVREIASQLGRSPSTISRELRRNAATRSGSFEYRATTAQWHADLRAKRPKVAKLAANDALRDYVQERLAGLVTAPDGTAISDPAVPWVGRRHGRRKDRRWASAWSPEQISNRLRVDFPYDESMRVSHEAIYQALYVQGRGALRRDLSACLRTGRALRVPRARTQARGKKFVSPEVLISERPAEVEERAVPGHWEGDLILGLGSSAIGSLVERTTRFTMLLHLPRLEGHGTTPRTKNGPALAGHGAQAVRDAIVMTIGELPEHLRRTLTWDQGAEMSQHAQLRIDAGIAIYFCDPHSPWQRGTNENTNGLLRQYFPKGTDLSRHSARELAAVAATLNTRPRKTLGWRTPAEALDLLLRSVQEGGVATTP